MGKRLIITEEERKRILNLYEQRISDLPQNQQTYTGPKPNIGTPKTKDLRTTLSPQQQQQYKDMTRGQKDLFKIYYGGNKEISPIGKDPSLVEKVRLIFPKADWEKIGLRFFSMFNIFSGYFTSLADALKLVGNLINKGVKTKELVIGSHGGGEQLLMTKSGENFRFDNSFLESIKEIVTPSTKVFFTACHGADDLEMLKDAAEKLGVGAYASKGVYNYITNESEKGFYWCSPNSYNVPRDSKPEEPLNPIEEQKKSAQVQVRFLSKEKPTEINYTITTEIFGIPIKTIKKFNFESKNYGVSSINKGEFLIEGWIDINYDLEEYIGGYTDNPPANQDALAKSWYNQSKKTPNMEEFLGNKFVNGEIKIELDGADIKTLKPFSLPLSVDDDFLLENNLCRKVESSPVSWFEPIS
jgi:hypothetical protein